MAYSVPPGDAVDFNLDSGYSIPPPDQLNFDNRVTVGNTITNAEEVWVLSASGVVVEMVTPDETGAWTVDLPPDSYYIAALAPEAGCQPLMHGPFGVGMT